MPKRRFQPIPATNLTICSTIHQWSNNMTGGFLYAMDTGTLGGKSLRVAIVMFYVVLAVFLMAAATFLRRRIHVVHWLGGWPQSTVIVAMLVVVTSFFIMMRIRIVRFFRHQQTRTDIPKRDEDSGNVKPAKRSWGFNISLLKPVLFINLALAISSIVLGVWTAKYGGDVRGYLENKDGCSSYATARPLQNTSERLVLFQKACHLIQGSATHLSDCTDFSKQFHPAPASAASYLMRLERQEGCTGFCTPADPLAISGRETPASSTLSCAEAIGSDIRKASLWASIPSICIGTFQVLFDIFLLDYDQL